MSSSAPNLHVAIIAKVSYARKKTTHVSTNPRGRNQRLIPGPIWSEPRMSLEFFSSSNADPRFAQFREEFLSRLESTEHGQIMSKAMAIESQKYRALTYARSNNPGSRSWSCITPIYARSPDQTKLQLLITEQDRARIRLYFPAASGLPLSEDDIPQDGTAHTSPSTGHVQNSTYNALVYGSEYSTRLSRTQKGLKRQITASKEDLQLCCEDFAIDMKDSILKDRRWAGLGVSVLRRSFFTKGAVTESITPPQ